MGSAPWDPCGSTGRFGRSGLNPRSPGAPRGKNLSKIPRSGARQGNLKTQTDPLRPIHHFPRAAGWHQANRKGQIGPSLGL